MLGIINIILSLLLPQFLYCLMMKKKKEEEEEEENRADLYLLYY